MEHQIATRFKAVLFNSVIARSRLTAFAARRIVMRQCEAGCKQVGRLLTDLVCSRSGHIPRDNPVVLCVHYPRKQSTRTAAELPRRQKVLRTAESGRPTRAPLKITDLGGGGGTAWKTNEVSCFPLGCRVQSG